MATTLPDGSPIDIEENRRRMLAGELYWAYVPDLVNNRRRCAAALRKFNNAVGSSRREIVQLWLDLVQDETPLPPQLANEEEDEASLQNFPWVDGPIRMDLGCNIKIGNNAYIGPNTTWVDPCTITVGARTLIGPNCSFYGASHPLDYKVRNGTQGPELGKPITIGEDCWFGGNVVVLPGVTVGKGAVVGAGSVVTKDVAAEAVVVGNPARVLRRLDSPEAIPNMQA